MDDMAKVRAKAERLVKKLHKTQQELKALQEACPHPNRTKEHKANTGNYDPSSDRYWTVFHCPDCGNQWSVDGSV